MAAMSRSMVALLCLAIMPVISGCATGAVGPPTYPLRTARAHVDKQLGPPIETRALPDGGHVATYRYPVFDRGPNPIAAFAMDGVMRGAGGGAGAGVVALALLGIAAAAVAHQATTPSSYLTVKFTYSPYGELLHDGAPPRYGPEDDAVGQPTIGALRMSCASDGERDERQYVECVVRRFAAWGIE
jgi:hypothetical protein